MKLRSHIHTQDFKGGRQHPLSIDWVKQPLVTVDREHHPEESVPHMEVKITGYLWVPEGISNLR